MGVMTDPFIAGRGDPISGGGNPNAYADEGSLAYAAKRKPNDALAAIYTKAPPIAPVFEQRWSVWAAGYGGSQTNRWRSRVLGSNDARSSIYGGAVGADYRISPNTLAGFALAGGGTNFSVNGFGSGRSDLFQAGAFIRHNIGPAYITGALAYGWQDITTDRTVTVAGIDRLRAQFNANAWSGRVEGGYRFVSQGFGWTPYAAAQFTTFDLPAYAEQAIVGSNRSPSPTIPRASPTPAANSACAPTNRSRCRTASSRCAAAPPGPMISTGPQHRRHVPDAAGRLLHRQRRATGRRRGARHRLGRNEMDQRLVGRRRRSRASSRT